MKKLICLVFGFLFSVSSFASAEKPPCSKWPGWFKKACLRTRQIWYEGHNDLLIPAYSWHNRFTYTPERIKKYNENAWGLGLGKSIEDEDGDFHGLYAMAFLDSHSDIEPIAGYAFLKAAHLNQNTSLGLGFTAFVTARSDMYHNYPFPGALPLVSAAYKRLTVFATYIPGAQGAGNVLFIFAKYRLD